MAEQRVAIVTAAGRGMGAACARELAARGYALARDQPGKQLLGDRLTGGR